MKICKVCGNFIPEGRIKAIPNTQTCIDCSDTDKKKDFTVITGKTTYSEIDIVDDHIYNVLNNFDRKKYSEIN
jgi:RNA polymerase-binding transcription factor DksA